MKNLSFSLVIFITMVSLNSCRSTCNKTVNYYAKVPVYASLESIRQGFEVLGVRQMDTITSIVELNHAYFLEEKGKGVHVIEKNTWANPKRVGFIKIPGCLAIEGKGRTLYVGQATDLITIDVSNLNAIRKVATHTDIFNEEFVKADSFIVGYKSEYVTMILEDQDCGDTYIYPEDASEITSRSIEPQIDLHVTNDLLLVVDNTQFTSFTIASQGNVAINASTLLGFSGNTSKQEIKSTEDFIIVGSPTSNFFIFQNDQSMARIVSTFVSSPFTCGTFYLFDDAILFPDFTETPGSNCNSINALHVLPINGVIRPFFPTQFRLTQPQSLAFSDSTMLLCDGSGGFRLMDIQNPGTFNPATDTYDQITTIHSAQGVLSSERALVWGNDGLHYINVEDPRNISVITEIK